MGFQQSTGLVRALARAGAIAGVVGVMLAGPVAAANPVDPNILNPPPPDFFNAECHAAAGGTLCSLHFSDDPIVDEPSGIVCGRTELLFSQERSVVGKRTYDADGNLVQRHFREMFTGTFTNPDTHVVVPWIQHDTIVHNLGIPGEMESGTIKTTGLLTRVSLPGGGTILVDAGTTLEDFATGDLIHEGGKHSIRDYFVNGDGGAIQPLCDALD
jgi:hypothetical protein